jgi:hypothetical protein
MTREAASVRTEVGRFLGRALLLAAPLIFAMVIYLANDPFKVLYHHDFGNYYDQAAPVEINRDYVSLTLFRKNDPEQHFDSFIFGSSRSFPLHCDTWKKLVPGIRPFHYPAGSENLEGVYLKVKYFHENHVPLKHVILEMWAPGYHDLSRRRDHIHRLPYLLTGESWLDYQGGVLGSYFQALFFAHYDYYKVTGHVHPSSKSKLAIYPGMVRIDPSVNDYFWAAEERELAESEDAYYAKRADRFKRADTPFWPPGIGPAQRHHLEEIRDIFREQHTDVRLMIPPTYDQQAIGPEDLAILREMFGAENVFDFSGRNEWTEDMHHYYDPGHVRPYIGDKLLAAMYARP